MAELRDSMSDAQGPIAFLRSPSTIRARCREVLDLGLEGKLDHFEVRMDALAKVVERTLAVTLEKAGKSQEARAHWRAYRQLAPEGEWVELAREFGD